MMSRESSIGNSTVQTRAPNDLIYSKWQQPYRNAFASLFYSGKKRRSFWIFFPSFFTVYGANTYELKVRVNRKFLTIFTSVL